MGVREFIGRAQALSGAAPELLDRMAEAATLHEFARGDMLWHAGDPALNLTIIKSGLVKVVRPVARGRAAICGLFGPPDTVGDLAVLRGVPYPADAIVATDNASLISVPGKFLSEASEKNPAFAVSLACAMQTKLSALHDKVDVLSAGSVEARLALLLLKLYDRFGDDFDDGTSTVPVALSRRELADLVATSFETAIRVMTRWDREGVLETTSQGFIIKKLAALRTVTGVDPTENVSA
jgi:CRP/FNR family transcriptional regulator